MGKCVSPFQKEHKGKMLPLPCGKCYECKQRRASGWSYRMQKEAERSTASHFITLTYQDPPMTNNGFMTVKKTDIQNFMKIARKTQGNKIKYYCAAEYGSKTKRPHYHMIVFNLTDVDAFIRSWKHGSTHVGKLTAASAAYTLKYISKGKTVPQHQNDDREPEFALSSKKLGENYLTPEIQQWHKNDLKRRAYIPLMDGKKIALPRYYKDKLYTEQEKQQIANYMKANELKQFEGKNFQEIMKLMEKSHNIVTAKAKRYAKKSNEGDKI